MVALLQDETRSYIFFPNEQVRHTALARLADESVNDFNDRSIRAAARYFRDIFSSDSTCTGDSSSNQACLISNDADNLVGIGNFVYIVLLVICLVIYC